MTDQVTFRTTDSTRWGNGFGSDLSATQVDINFWVLLTAIQAIQAEAAGQAGIDHFVVSANQLFVHLTNHFVLGPYILPMAQWNFRGEWSPSTSYAVFDVFTEARATYLVTLAHVSSSLFSAGANDGNGHNFYAQLLAAAPPELPQTGAAGAVLTWNNSPADVSWNTPTRNIGLYLETSGQPIENVLDYLVPENMTFPQGLTGSLFGSSNHPTVDQEYDLFQDGGPIGSVIFETDGTQTISFPHPIIFDVGDVFSIVGPSVPDPHHTRIRFTFVGQLP